MERRKFIKTTAAGSLAVSTVPTILTGNRWKGANDRVNLAVIGVRGMGQNHIQEYQKLENVEVAALCDVDQNLFAERIKKHFTDKDLKTPQLYSDMRKLFENKNIDAVSVVTPNHWHSLAAIWAIQAGKHVSVEKPCCHNIYEGQKLVEAAKKYDVIVQDGAEQRSNPCAISMADHLHSGKLGEVYMAKGLCFKWRDSIGSYPDGPMEKDEQFAFTVGSKNYVTPYTKEYLSKVDYNMWLGPTPELPFNRNRFHYNWHWNWLYGNGDMGNQGVHEMDIARWGLGVKLPAKISSIGGHFIFDDAQTTPNDQITVFEFPNPDGSGDKKKILQFEVRHWMSNRELASKAGETGNTYMVSDTNEIGNLFYGSEGFMSKTVNNWQVFEGQKREAGASGDGLGNHYQNFIHAIRANDQKLAKADIEEGFYSCALIHLGNISYRLGRTLEFDPETMKFINDPEADTMLTREYREPFVVPEHV
ncbi:Gfo/Idh/MocA family protein [Maribellus maritimus]|uniref:Gfo/Idh/MocA family protein n=1 Tax=Maribellus maritimus TaxID=2870838 RepID=UPI001EEAA377|nr:Gfo/Idh/MocA family oxidoreductase [Maribellus maritimus]MCG6185942.1 Gfo/Idh/MocA family oxidoreductase [Maribellus maritimus]